MSAGEIADYVSFRRAKRYLYNLATTKFPITGMNSELSYFKKIERGIRVLRLYSEIASMEETKRILEAAMAGKGLDGWHAGGRRKKLATEIYDTLPPVLRMSNLLSVTKMPPRNPAMKGRIVDLIRRLYDLKENMPEIPEGKYVNLNSTELFLGARGTMYSALAGILSEVKSVDPLAEAEDHYQDAYRYLNPDDGYNVTAKKLENMMPAMASLEALFGVIKPYHDITDYDTGQLKELKDLQDMLFKVQEELEISKDANRRLLQYSPAVSKSRYEPSSVAPVKESIALLSGFVDESTIIKDGKVELNPNVEALERIFNSIKTKLEGTSFLVLYGQAQDSLDGVQKSNGDPVTLMRLAKVYKHMASMTLDTQVERSNRKENIRSLIPDSRGF